MTEILGIVHSLPFFIIGKFYIARLLGENSATREILLAVLVGTF